MNGRSLSSLTAALFGVAMLTACGGGGGSTPPTSSPTPVVTPTPTGPPTTPPTVTGWQTDLFLTGSSGQVQPQSKTRRNLASYGPEIAARRRFAAGEATAYVPGVVEVMYGRSVFLQRRSELSAAASRNASIGDTLDFAKIGQVAQVLHVPEGTEDAVIAQMKSQPGVSYAGRAVYRHLESTTAAFTNDPYYNGFAPYNTLPVYENSQSPGQWDLHAIYAANAWGYAGANPTGLHAGAAGGNVNLAIIDTGVDTTHPELAPAGTRIVFTETVLKGSVTTTGMHDNDGHGTNVAGIAAASGNNNLGFAGVAYNTPLMIFKVFPDPGTCTGTACDASSTDIARAISDAVANGAKVISMSLGADSADPTEESAVANAIAAHVVVVAAAGNGNSAGVGNAALSYPAADPGVIAVGATSIDDSNPANAGLRVASYSNYVTGARTDGGVYLVAPGGDACPFSTSSSCNDTDNLHWIENIYSSTAQQQGDCRPDFGSTSAVIDCRILIEGTSQATPHVAGAAALLLSVGDTAADVPSRLCSTSTQLLPSSFQASHQGCGQLNVYKALNSFLGDPTYP